MCGSHIRGGGEGQGKGERRGHSSGLVARVWLPIGALERNREVGLGTQTGWEAEGCPGMSEGSRVVVRGEGLGDSKGEGQDQVRVKVNGRWR